MTTEEWLKIVNQCDPLYLIEAGAPWNEYDIEIPELVEKATSCQSAEELGELIYEVFFKRFGDSTHQDKEKYLVAAEKAWIRLHPSDVK